MKENESAVEEEGKKIRRKQTGGGEFLFCVISLHVPRGCVSGVDT